MTGARLWRSSPTASRSWWAGGAGFHPQPGVRSSRSGTTITRPAPTPPPPPWAARTAGRGTVIGGAIEASTVDIAREFTNLIVFQRGYQANSRVVTAVDEMSQDTINLKR